MTHCRIHIIGPTGSGKTYISQVLSNKLGICCYELDTVMWSSPVEFADKRPPEVRQKLLEEIIGQDSWIVEGVYYKWLVENFEKAQVIIYVDTNVIVRHARIVLRFVKQRTGLERSVYKQMLKGLLKMLGWNHRFDQTDKVSIYETLQPYWHKVNIVRKNEDVEKLPESFVL